MEQERRQPVVVTEIPTFDTQQDFDLWAAEISGDFELWEREFSLPETVEELDELGLERDALVAMSESSTLSEDEVTTIAAETPSEPWVEANPDGSLSYEDYNQRMRWRASNVGIALDVVRDQVDESRAAEWFALKQAVSELTGSGYYRNKIDAVIALERVAYVFVTGFDFDGDDYEGRRNK